MSSSAASRSGREASAANPPRRPPLLVRHPAAAARTLPPSSRRGYNLSPTPPTLAAEVPPQIEQPAVSPPAPAAAPSAIQRREGIQGLHAAQGLHGARAARPSRCERKGLPAAAHGSTLARRGRKGRRQQQRALHHDNTCSSPSVPILLPYVPQLFAKMPARIERILFCRFVYQLYIIF